ncbi:hypothetical protein SAMN06297251_11471 [Fulvimarina manganoxydans]|uniref:Uncharacterized protein n=1 Tax=Fulvimarina manganoxydans TaxID=937218 RepID=A0A1W2DES1_9HYPH|nr:hypothetical protein [Fulvimarina manganoxydans]MEE2951455.1 hypothetical protein [Pseudomonadota bacterium]SMC95764.1 hypothetical protein SAMN06297251_11471 [Fulvimarina manganoxydans]
MSRHASSGTTEGALVVIFGAIIGLIIAAYLYITPLTGITGSFGAILVIVSSALLILDGVMLLGAVTPGSRGVWLTLGFLGALGTLAAAWFLHAFFLMAAMVVVLVGLVMALARPPYATAAASR